MLSYQIRLLPRKSFRLELTLKLNDVNFKTLLFRSHITFYYSSYAYISTIYLLTVCSGYSSQHINNHSVHLFMN